MNKIKLNYGKASNRLNELKQNIPFAKKEFDRFINSVASWQNSYTLRMEVKLMNDLNKLQKKWERKAILEANK
jgi:hypothetical protein